MLSNIKQSAHPSDKLHFNSSDPRGNPMYQGSNDQTSAIIDGVLSSKSFKLIVEAVRGMVSMSQRGIIEAVVGTDYVYDMVKRTLYTYPSKNKLLRKPAAAVSTVSASLTENPPPRSHNEVNHDPIHRFRSGQLAGAQRRYRSAANIASVRMRDHMKRANDVYNNSMFSKLTATSHIQTIRDTAARAIARYVENEKKGSRGYVDRYVLGKRSDAENTYINNRISKTQNKNDTKPVIIVTRDGAVYQDRMDSSFMPRRSVLRSNAYIR